MSTVYTVASAKGGVGKTATTANLGTALAAAGHDVVVVDGDIGMANLATVLGVEPTGATLHAVLAGDASVEDAIYEGPVGLDVIPGSTDIDDFREADSRGLAEVLAALTDYDYVFIDTGSGLSHDSALPLGLADEVVLVSSPEPTALIDTAKTNELAKRLDATVRGIVVTRMTDEIQFEIPEEIDLDVTPLGNVPDDPQVLAALAAREPLCTFAPASPAACAYRELAAELTGVSIPTPPEAEAAAATAGDDEEAAAGDDEEAAAGDDEVAAVDTAESPATDDDTPDSDEDEATTAESVDGDDATTAESVDGDDATTAEQSTEDEADGWTGSEDGDSPSMSDEEGETVLANAAQESSGIGVATTLERVEDDELDEESTAEDDAALEPLVEEAEPAPDGDEQPAAEASTDDADAAIDETTAVESDAADDETGADEGSPTGDDDDDAEVEAGEEPDASEDEADVDESDASEAEADVDESDASEAEVDVDESDVSEAEADVDESDVSEAETDDGSDASEAAVGDESDANEAESDTSEAEADDDESDAGDEDSDSKRGGFFRRFLGG